MIKIKESSIFSNNQKRKIVFMKEYFAVSDFFKKCGMHPDDIDMSSEREKYAKQMNDGLQGKESTLMMIPAYLSMEGEIPQNRKVIVLDAGGTNFRVATAYFNDKCMPVIEDFQKIKMPGFNQEITIKDFYVSVADYLMSVIDKSDKIGFCFSYPVEILPNRDGRIYSLSKEIHIADSDGALVCEGIKEVLLERGIKNKDFVVLNDTVASMLSAKADSFETNYETFIGFILGTGVNACYLEKTENVKKCADTGMKNMIITLEAGGYCGIAQGEADKELDNETVTPGTFQFEKMTSGAYMGTLILKTINHACKNQLFSDEFCVKFKNIESISLRDVDDFCFYPFGNNTLASLVLNNDSDRKTLYYIIDFLFERASKIIACAFAGIMKHTGYGSDPTRPVCICCEGTTFHKSKLYRGKIEYYIKDYIENQMHRYIELAKSQNSPLIGAAIAALLN